MLFLTSENFSNESFGALSDVPVERWSDTPAHTSSSRLEMAGAIAQSVLLTLAALAVPVAVVLLA